MLDEPAAAFTPRGDAPVIVTDQGFAADDWSGRVVDLAPDSDIRELAADLPQNALIRVAFPGFADGRGFTIARRLRLAGYTGRLRAAGHVIADQYAMARRSGFDEVEISADLARRQPWEQWQERSHWQGGYLPRLGWQG
ncbi:MAG: DUF934 domain-containing protein [Paracoccus sp. (in: a-proteobacteria)]|nr:DUF934 domain-containing protein [Paracoccus sp. (in: a-proteobacteria)]